MASSDNIFQQHSTISALVFSILLALLFIYLSLFISFIIYFIPVEVFFVMHYLKVWRFKQRILGATIVFFVAVIFAAGLYAQTLYTSNGVEAQKLSNGSYVIASVDPFNHTSSSYNFSFSISGNESIHNYYLLIRGLNTNYLANISESQIGTANNSTGALILYYHDITLVPSGIYEYYLYFDNGTSVVSSVGPIFSTTPLFELYIYDLAPPFMLTFELIFIVGLFIARSISNSARLRNNQLRPRTPPPQDSTEAEMVDSTTESAMEPDKDQPK